MILKALKYTRFEGEPREWSIVGKKDAVNNSFAYFGNFNLLVGKNASGKSRTLDVIRKIANLFSGRIILNEAVYSSEKFELIFEKEDIKYEYLLNFKDRKVIDECLTVNGEIVLDRKKGYLKNLSDGQQLDFDIDPSHLAINATVADKPLFESFLIWGKLFKNFLFSSHSEKNFLAKDLTKIEDEDQDIEDTSVLIYAFHNGYESFGDDFVNEIKSGMSELGYPGITNIGIQSTKQGYGIYIEEDGRYQVSQREMAQGMFRILSLLIQLTFVRMGKRSICVLIDDVGEGLDYERSKGLIDLLIKKIGYTNIQFFMTSNDRYVMNKIPLRYWTVIDRVRSQSVFYNYENSKENFDDFKYTGLNNFDFLTSDFYSKGFGNIEE